MLKLFKKLFAVYFFSLLSTYAQAQITTCAGFPLVTGFSSDIPQSCLGLVATAEQIPWGMPRRVAL